MSGNVYVDARKIRLSGELVPCSGQVHVKHLSSVYVSRGGYKLAGAIGEFGIEIHGRIGVDAGASKGGFTDCLLQHGASKVYAVDVGYGQLAGKLRTDPRVVVLERTNISDVSPDDLIPPPDLATLDLSYLSLRIAIPTVARLLTGPRDMICLVKPLFEVENSMARRTGVIENSETYFEILESLVRYAETLGYTPRGVAASPILGRKGTVEFFLWVSANNGSRIGEKAIRGAVERALSQRR